MSQTFELIPSLPGFPPLKPSVLNERACLNAARSLGEDAGAFCPTQGIADAINTALCVGEPLLLTGEPGTGKTQTAYFAAHQLGIGTGPDRVFHFQVKSDSQARDLFYHFDTVGYFHAANIAKLENTNIAKLDKKPFVEKGKLWEAYDKGKELGHPCVLLLDEIDKAPRDFPNDLLHELDQMNFEVKEINLRVDMTPQCRPLVFITSNSERRLPEPFLRRCVYHHIRFDKDLLKSVVEAKKRAGNYTKLSNQFIENAIQRFLDLRDSSLRKPPSTAEFLVWLRLLEAAGKVKEAQLGDSDLSRLPYLGALLKTQADLEQFRGS